MDPGSTAVFHSRRQIIAQPMALGTNICHRPKLNTDLPLKYNIGLSFLANLSHVTIDILSVLRLEILVSG